MIKRLFCLIFGHTPIQYTGPEPQISIFDPNNPFAKQKMNIKFCGRCKDVSYVHLITTARQFREVFK